MAAKVSKVVANCDISLMLYLPLSILWAKVVGKKKYSYSIKLNNLNSRLKKKS